LIHGLAGRIVQAHAARLDEVERELGDSGRIDRP
jgi:hypothetical protein